MRKNIFMRKCCAGVLALTTVLTAASITNAATSVEANAAATLTGDVNSDGQVSVADAVKLQQYLIKKGTLTNGGYENADMNADSKVNVIDLSLLKANLVQPTGDNIIYLNGTSIESSSSGVTIEGTTATITKSGSYVIKGEMTTDSQIIVNTAAEDVDAVELSLEDVTMTNSTDLACILIENADKTKVTFSGSNTLTNNFDTAAPTTAVIDAKDDITFTKNSTGTLNITSVSEDGISCNNDIKVNGGTINVVTGTDSTGVADGDAVKAQQTVTVAGGNLTIDAGGDGIKSTQADVVISSGTVSVKAGNDAIQAETDVTVSDGSVVACGDRSITAVGNLAINGGSVLATATDSVPSYASYTGSQAAVSLSYAAQHKKAETIAVGTSTYTAVKKYQYALVSDASIAQGSVYNVYTNGTQMAADEATDGNFAVGSAVAAFTNVAELAGGGTQSSEPVSSDTGVAYYLVYSDSAVTLKDASGAVLKTATNVTVDGDKATITVPGEYDISGSSTDGDGKLTVNVDKTAYPDDGLGTNQVTLVFDGITLSNSTEAPVYIESIDDECAISVKKGTTNTISDGTSHTDTYVNSDNETKTVCAAIYARDDLKIKGKGTLVVKGNYEDGIVTTNDLKIWNGSIDVTAVDDGIRGSDSVRIGDPDDAVSAGGSGYDTLSVKVKTTTSGDGIKSTSTETDKGYITINGGTIDIDSYSDGIQAEQTFTMNDGNVDITTYQGSAYTASGSSSSSSGSQWGGMGGMQDGNPNKTDVSAKGIKAVGLYDSTGTTYQSGGDLNITGGTIVIDSSDDCLHCAGTLSLTGGVYTLATADDGIHSDTTVNIGAGSATTFDDVQIYVSKCYEGVEGSTINQNSGSVYIISGDDGYNAGGGSDGSGTGNTGGPGQGWGQGSMTSGGNYALNLKGGLVVVNSAQGDHDAFDSNGTLTVSDGYYCANGQEPMDYDGTFSFTGGCYLTMQAGNTNLNTRYTFLDASGNAIISFVSAQGAGANCKTGSAQSGGTISGGTTVNAQAGSYSATAGGTLSGGTAVGAGSSQGQQPTRP